MTPNVLLELEKTLLYLFSPAPCLACGELDRDLRRPLGLCTRCRGRLVELREPCCRSCALPLAGAAVPPGYRCGPCRLQPPVFERLVAHWVYQPPLDQVILRLKFGRLRFLGRHLGLPLARRLARDPPAANLVVPIPLHWRRALERGYNQAREIAEIVARELDLPLVGALKRRRATRPQMGIEHRRRQKNLQTAFACTRPHRIAGRSVLLIDDVVTTGATLNEAALTLRNAGAGVILAAVVARTPEPGPLPRSLG